VIIAWSLLARRDLEQLRAYIERDNPAAAARTADRILDAAERLEQFPHLGRPGRETATRELVVPRTPYILIYRVRGEVLEMLRVLHGAQRWPVEPGEH
jgi:addiction module RelE/StbE family toxin